MGRIPDLQRGIAAFWPARTKTAKALRMAAPAIPMEGVYAYNARLDQGNEIKAIPTPEYLSVAANRQINAIASVLEGESAWMTNLALAVQYHTFAYRLSYFWHEQFRVLFPQNSRPLAVMNWEYMTNAMAFGFMLGWNDISIYQGYLTHAVLNRRFQLKVSYENEHRRAHAFMLRLFADWRGDGTGHAWPEWGRDVAVYEGVLQHWRATDAEKIRPWLIAACDRHTHESKYDTETTFFDFGDEIYTHTPLEILLVLRLRALCGLENPVLDHPLMAAPFDKLPEHEPVLEADELMNGTQARAEGDWSNLRSVTAIENIKKWASLTS